MYVIRFSARVLLLFLATIVITIFYTNVSTASTVLKKDKPPNIVYILLDDLGYGDVGVYGSDIETPYIDRTAREGMRFTQYYTSPVCAPTRASILTGRYPQEFGIRRASAGGRLSQRGVPGSAVMLSEILQHRKFRTAHIGKWHLGFNKDEYRPIHQGFDYSAMAHTLLATAPGYKNPKITINDETVVEEVGHKTQVLTDYAIRFLEEQDGQTPFFLNLWYHAPHGPIEPPEDWKEKWNYQDTLRGRFKALVSFADEQIGRVLDTLDGLGLSKNTLVVIASDNGGANSPHVSNGDLRGFKVQVFEGGIRAPLIIRWPGHIEPDTQNDSVIASFDFFPTFAEIVGIDMTRLPSEIKGKSFLHLLENSSRTTVMREDILVWENKFSNRIFNSPSGILNNFSVRKKDWKLVFENNNKRSEPYLFDIFLDPGETQDLASRNSIVVDELLSEYWAWRKQVGPIDYTYSVTAGYVRANEEDNFVFEDPGRVTLDRNALFDFHDGDFSCTARIKLDVRSFESRASVIARKHKSFSFKVMHDGRLKLVLFHHDFDENRKRAKLVSQTVLQPDESYDVAFTVYGNRLDNSIIRLYINGQLEAENKEVWAVQSNDHVINVGNNRWLGKNDRSSRQFVGEINQLKFYTLSLTQKELSESLVREDS